MQCELARDRERVSAWLVNETFESIDFDDCESLIAFRRGCLYAREPVVRVPCW